MSKTPIILASGSPRRRDLLAGLGLSFEVVPADIDESVLSGETPDALVARLSEGKARAVAETHQDALIIAADTVVVLGGEILGKPASSEENRTFIERLAEREHIVYTGHALLYKGKIDVNVVTTKVRFRALSEAEIDWYVATGDGLDKAGGYGIQGKGAAFIPYIEGCYFNVMGMSVANVLMGAKRLGVALV